MPQCIGSTHVPQRRHRVLPDSPREKVILHVDYQESIACFRGDLAVHLFTEEYSNSAHEHYEADISGIQARNAAFPKAAGSRALPIHDGRWGKTASHQLDKCISAQRITVLAPYLAYARKDQKSKSRDPVTTRYVAQLFEAVGTDRLVTMDVHNLAAFQNAFRCRTEHLVATKLMGLCSALRKLQRRQGFHPQRNPETPQCIEQYLHPGFGDID